MIKAFDPARTEDIRDYQSWVKKHTPIEKVEARFLEHESDLLAITPRKSTHSAPIINHYLAFGVPLALLLALVTFAMIPDLLGRTFVVAIIAVLEGAVVYFMGLSSVMAIREWILCAVMYVFPPLPFICDLLNGS